MNLEKDTLTVKNKILKDLISNDRVLIEYAPPALITSIEGFMSEVDAKLSVVRNKDDIGDAARMRNSGQKVVFVFNSNITPDSYFTGTSSKVALPTALLNRFELNY